VQLPRRDKAPTKRKERDSPQRHGVHRGFNFQQFPLRVLGASFENLAGGGLAAHRPGDLSQCHSEEPSDEESACYLFGGGSKT
jgi:hypothetical protein